MKKSREPYQIAIFKFNNGNGALLCNRCDVIIDVGNHEREDKLHFCEKCEPHKQEWCLDELAKMTQEFEFKNDYDRLDDN